MDKRDTILTVNIVEPGLVAAIKRHSQEMQRELKGIVIVDASYVDSPGRQRDESGFFKEVVCDDVNDPVALQKALRPYEGRILAATCRSESAMDIFPKIIPFIPYVDTPTETSLIWATSKSQMRDRLHGYDERLVPKYKYVERADLPKVNEMIQEFTFPVIVKPTGLAESLLVTRCNDTEQLHACLERTFNVIDDIYKRERRTGRRGLLIEEMIQGDMYSVDAYVSAKGDIYCLPLVKVLTAHALGKRGFYGHTRSTPVDMPEATIEAAFEACKSAIRALGLRSVTSHIELFHTADGWKIIELAGRMGGYRERLYHDAYGVDHYYNDLAIRMGKEPQMPSEAQAHAACMHIYADDEGQIDAIDGLDSVEALESTVAIMALMEPGDQAVHAENGGMTVVKGMFHNKDPEQLKRDVEAAREYISIKVRSS